jgi:hypothetical protein
MHNSIAVAIVVLTTAEQEQRKPNIKKKQFIFKVMNLEHIKEQHLALCTEFSDVMQHVRYSCWLRAGLLKDRSLSPGRGTMLLFSASSKPVLDSAQFTICCVPQG